MAITRLKDAANMLRFNADKLNTRQQLHLTNYLLNNNFNLRMIAQRLRQLILFDYLNADTEHLIDEQLIVAGSRYNLGTDLEKQVVIRSISTLKSIQRSYNAYGRHILEKRKTLNTILELM